MRHLKMLKHLETNHTLNGSKIIKMNEKSINLLPKNQTKISVQTSERNQQRNLFHHWHSIHRAPSNFLNLLAVVSIQNVDIQRFVE